MVRTSKLLLWIVVLPVGLGLFLTSVGVAEPYLSASDLPVEPFQGVVVGVTVLVSGLVVSDVLDRLAWRRMGRQAGLPPDGIVILHDNPPDGNRKFLANPELTGTVRGRPDRNGPWTASPRADVHDRRRAKQLLDHLHCGGDGVRNAGRVDRDDRPGHRRRDGRAVRSRREPVDGRRRRVCRLG